MQRHYSKAPITEAIIDFRVTLPESFPVDRIEEIHSRIKDNFSTNEIFEESITDRTKELID